MRSALLVLLLLVLVPAGPLAAQDRDDFEAACAFGQLGACNVLGLMYETGAGVDQDLERAREIYADACDAGEPSGCTSLGLLMAQGLGSPEDRPGAAALYGRACDAGDEFGCDLLAALEHEGPFTEPQSFFKHGRVGDAESATMLAGALVDVPRLGVRAVTDAEGRLSLGKIEEGRYELRAEALGYEPINGTMIVPGYSEFVVLLQPMKWDHPDAPGTIEGRITDDLGVGIADVDVSVVEREGVRSLTNQDGRFALHNVAAGLVTVQFSRLGYATRETMLVVQPEGRSRVDAVMSTDAIEIDPIEVSVEGRSAYLQRSGFYRRQRRGFGQQLTRDDFIGAAETIGDLIQQRRGVRVVRDIFGREFVIGTRAGASCRFDAYVDGLKTRDGNVNWATPDQIEGIEIYQGMDVPPEYGRGGNCGVVLVWTIRP